MTRADVRANEFTPDAGVGPQTWFERHGDFLYRFAFGRVRSADVAEDLVQETLLAAWKARARYRNQASERTWLASILKRKAIDWVRGRVRERKHFALGSDRFADDLFDRRGKWKQAPGQRARENSVESLDREQFWATLRDCVDKLPVRLQEVFTLRYLDDSATEVVCRELKIAPTHFWVLLHRARLRLWWCLSKNWFGEEPQGGKPNT